IEQWSVTAGASDVEGVENPVLKDVHIVERNSAQEFRALATYIPGLERQIGSERSLDLEIPILDIRNHAIYVGRAKRLSSLVEWFDSERHDGWSRRWNRHR